MKTCYVVQADLKFLGSDDCLALASSVSGPTDACYYIWLFVHLSNDKHLDGFHLLTVMKSAAMRADVQVFEALPASSLPCLFLLSIYLEMVILDTRVICLRI